MEIKLANHHKYSFEEVIAAQSNGGSFVTYQWILPRPIIYPVRRLSKVYFIPAETNKAKYGRRFNILSLIFGWWGLPFGPMAVRDSIKINNSGGVDVTGDVYLNLDKTGYSNGRFQLKNSFIKFIHPQKSEIKEHLKVFKALVESNELNELPFIGEFIDCEDGVEPHTVIGFTENMEMKRALITDAIYKRFRKNYVFELVELNDEFELSDELKTQGLKLKH